MAIQIADKTNFKDLIAEDFVIADFYGTTCVPCKLFSKILEDIEAEIPFLYIVKLNTTENPEIAAENQISALVMQVFLSVITTAYSSFVILRKISSYDGALM